MEPGHSYFLFLLLLFLQRPVGTSTVGGYSMVSHVHVFEQAIAEAAQTPQTPSGDPDAADMGRRRPVRQKRRTTVPFIRGPVPLKWLTKAMALSRSAARLAVALWYRLGITGQHADLTEPGGVQLVVRIDRQLRDECDLERWHVSEGVRDLSEAGLIRPLKAGRGRCPVVEVVTHGSTG